MRTLIVCGVIGAVIGVSVVVWTPASSGDEPYALAAEQPIGLDADWPTFRGDASLTGYRSGAVGEKPKLVWTYDAASAVESTAAVVSGRVFIGTAEEGLLCLSLAPKGRKGELLWKYPLELGTRSSPGVKDGRVYLADDEGILHCVDAMTGKGIWKFDTESGAEIISSVSFSGKNVLFGSYDAFLYAVDAEKGTLAWKSETLGPVHCTPAIGAGYTFVAGCDEYLRAVSLTDGEAAGGLPMGSYSASSPAVVGDRLFVGTFGQQVLGVRWAKNGKLALPPPPPIDGAEVPEEPGEAEPRPAPLPSPVKWAYEHPRRKFEYYASVAVGPLPPVAGAEPKKDGPELVVVACGRDRLVHALNADTGEELWNVPTKARIDASPVIVGAHVIVCGLDGVIRCLELRTGKEAWNYQAGAAMLASPAVAAGRLIVTTEEGLVHCFELRP